MALATGARLGAYEILASLGKGGMGEVYRAKDTKLGRDVAIKTLPSGLAQDADRLARFEREAKLLASLSHAHIGGIYGLDEHEGTLYIAMELVEGETLEEKLKPGPLPVEDALRLALQIAEALEAAHDKGVVHRDLKPANIMITRDGVVKVLDFGLAKAFSGDPNEASPAHSPALSLAMTQQGLILGTAAYMSPEQASGQATDQRADIWAFGVVVYEMLTGLPLFGGESVPHILADVLRSEPDWGRLPKRLHPRLKLLLERCLEKKVRNRYHSIADVRVDIEKILSDPAGVAPRPERDVRADRAWVRWLPYAAAVAAAAVVLAVFGWRAPQTSPARVERFTLELPAGEPLGIDTQSRSITISADGSKIVFSVAPVSTENYQWYVRAIDSVTATRLRGAEARFETPFFAPDGRWIGFQDLDRGELKRIPALGGPAITISAADSGVRGASWGQNDEILYGTDREGLWRVPASGGEPEQLTRPEGTASHRWPEWLPGERAALFTVADEEQGDQVALLDIASRETRVLIVDGTTPRYAATGHIVYGAADGSLRAVPFDLSTLTVTGDPVPLLEGVAMSALTGGMHYALSDEGSLIYITGRRTSSVRLPTTSLTWVDKQGREEPLGLPACSCRFFRIAPDGTRVVVEVHESDSTVSRSLWMWSFAQRTFTRLTFDPPTQSPVWSPDSTQVAYMGRNGGAPRIFARRADGTGEAQVLLDVGGAPYAWTADGRLLFDGTTNRRNEINILPSAGKREATVLLSSRSADIGQARLSPDGRWLAYTSTESGGREVYVRPFPDVDDGKWQISAQGGENARWSADSRTLYFVAPTQLMAVSVEDSASFRFGRPEPVFGIEAYLMPGRTLAYDVDPGNERFLIGKPVDAETGGQADLSDSAADASHIVLVQNWPEELTRLVPAK